MKLQYAGNVGRLFSISQREHCTLVVTAFKLRVRWQDYTRRSGVAFPDRGSQCLPAGRCTSEHIRKKFGKCSKNEYRSAVTKSLIIANCNTKKVMESDQQL